MEQLTITNILLMVLGLLINALTYLKKLKKEGKKLHLDAVLVLSSLIGVGAAFAGLIMAPDILSGLGATVSPDATLYMVHAFICGLLPNVIIDKVKKLSPLTK